MIRGLFYVAGDPMLSAILYCDQLSSLECFFILSGQLHGIVGLRNSAGGTLFGFEDLEFAFGLHDGPAVVALVDIGRFAIRVELDACHFFILYE